ncbi:hypothetical protein AB8Z38_00125 [Bradyrhizobium sp. LLZ17]|uniref:Uncharacterized protein n=1 Tax=Bradyrhizobium sp. LLZ17 TaxID=3239388 RepID=A0AB39XJ93_9BRAD
MVLIVRRETPSRNVTGNTATVAAQFLFTHEPPSSREGALRGGLQTLWTSKGHPPDFPLVQQLEHTSQKQQMKALYSHFSETLTWLSNKVVAKWTRAIAHKSGTFTTLADLCSCDTAWLAPGFHL